MKKGGKKRPHQLRKAGLEIEPLHKMAGQLCKVHYPCDHDGPVLHSQCALTGPSVQTHTQTEIKCLSVF